MPHSRRRLAGPAWALAFASLAWGSAASAQQVPLELTGAPTAATVRVRPGFRPDPGTVNLTAGGALPNPECNGRYPARPAVVLDATSAVTWMRVYVTSSADTSLAILTPDGHWRCAEDTWGQHPGVDGRFARGRYRVWVGAARNGPGVPAVLTITARRAQVPPSPTATPPATAPDAGTAAQNPLATATELAQQVLTGVTAPRTAPPSQTPGTAGNQGPLAVPLDALTRAGLDPNRLPDALGALLRQVDAGGMPQLTPAQLGQLGQLAQRGLDAGELASVANALLRGGGQAPASGQVLTPDQLGRVIELARSGATNAALQSAVEAMLRGATSGR